MNGYRNRALSMTKLETWSSQRRVFRPNWVCMCTTCGWITLLSLINTINKLGTLFNKFVFFFIFSSPWYAAIYGHLCVMWWVNRPVWQPARHIFVFRDSNRFGHISKTTKMYGHHSFRLKNEKIKCDKRIKTILKKVIRLL